MNQPGNRSQASAQPKPQQQSRQTITDEPHATGKPETRGVDALRADPMMSHLLEALDRGEDIGHYGRLVFTMIARHFLSGDELVTELTKDRDFSEEQARAMVEQVSERGYNPPRRDRILEWQREQRFQIVPDQRDPDCGNVYKTLRFERGTYKDIEEYHEEKAEAA